jgi:uncharacterized protein (TIGR02118 family)
MVKVLAAFKRKPAMDLDTFTQYWIGHANLVRKVPGISRYVQSQTIASIYAKREPVFDGIAEIWYEDTAAMYRTAATPEARTTKEDDKNFLDLTSFVSILTDEIVQLDGKVNSSMPKIVTFTLKLPSLSPEQFHKYWREVHGPLAAKIPQMRRYVQSHVRPSAYRDGGNPPLNGVASAWFESTATMREAEKTAQYSAVRNDEPNFVDQPKLSFIITRERVMI